MEIGLDFKIQYPMKNQKGPSLDDPSNTEALI